MKQLFIMCLINAMVLLKLNAQMVVTAPALESQTAIQNSLNEQSLSENINQSMTLSNIQGVQEQVLSIYKKSSSAIQNIQTFINLLQNMDKIKEDVQKIGKYEHVARQQGIDLPGIFSGIEKKFIQCTDLISSATNNDMTPAERINMVVRVADMVEEIIDTIGGIKTNIVSNIKSNILTNTIKKSLADVKLGPNVLNFKTK